MATEKVENHEVRVKALRFIKQKAKLKHAYRGGIASALAEYLTKETGTEFSYPAAYYYVTKVYPGVEGAIVIPKQFADGVKTGVKNRNGVKKTGEVKPGKSTDLLVVVAKPGTPGGDFDGGGSSVGDGIDFGGGGSGSIGGGGREVDGVDRFAVGGFDEIGGGDAIEEESEGIKSTYTQQEANFND
jgi:hypothetical protein